MISKKKSHINNSKLKHNLIPVEAKYKHGKNEQSKIHQQLNLIIKTRFHLIGKKKSMFSGYHEQTRSHNYK